MTMTAINPYDDIIDSRDVIERIAELSAMAGDMDDDEKQELADLIELEQEASDYAANWQYGEALIRDSYFVEYAQQLAEDIGAINSDASWPNTCIDWDQAARELQMDYTSVEFAGIDYWIR